MKVKYSGVEWSKVMQEITRTICRLRVAFTSVKDESGLSFLKGKLEGKSEWLNERRTYWEELHLLGFTVLYSTLLLTLLQFTPLYLTLHTLLYSIPRYFTLLYFTLLYYTLLLDFTPLYSTILYFPLLYFTLLYSTTLLYFTPVYSTILDFNLL